MISHDRVTVTTVVDVDPATAFEVFTKEIGTWWRREPRYRFTPGRAGTLRFDPGVGGRLIEVDEASGRESFEVGRVLAWEPGAEARGSPSSTEAGTACRPVTRRGTATRGRPSPT